MRADSGRTDIPTAGTAVRVNNINDAVKSAVFRAPVSNTGNVLVGMSDVEAVGTLNGWTLAPGEESPALNFGAGSVKFNVFWADAVTSGDDIEWLVIYEV